MVIKNTGNPICWLWSYPHFLVRSKSEEKKRKGGGKEVMEETPILSLPGGKRRTTLKDGFLMKEGRSSLLPVSMGGYLVDVCQAMCKLLRLL
jgi:hypothetical protein